VKRRKIQYRLIVPFVAAVAAMAAALFVLLYVWAAHADGQSRARDEQLITNASQTSFRQLEQGVALLATWDEAVRRLDNQFDVKWAQVYLTSQPSAPRAIGSHATFLLDSQGKVQFATLHGHVKSPEEFAAFARAAAPLVGAVRRAEAQRGPFIGKSESGDRIAYPIQFTAATMVEGTPFGLTVSLVQPSFGNALPKGDRAPVIVTGRAMDQTYLQLLSDRYLLKDLRLAPGVTPPRPGVGRFVVLDDDKRPLATLEWTVLRPGTEFLSKAVAPVSLVVLILAGGLFAVMVRSETVRHSLVRSEDRLQLALSAAKAGAFEIDRGAHTFWCSPETTEIIGRPLIDDEPFQIPWPIVHPDDVARLRGEAAAWRTGDRSGRIDDLRIVRPDGEVRWVKLSLRRDAGPSNALRITGLIQDIDERKRQELALVEAERVAQAAAEAKSAFLASMSHEIRTPMNGILGVLHLLKNEPVSEDGGQLLDEALACGRMLTTLIDDVLDLSKIEAGRLELSPVATDPAAAVEGVATLLRSQCEAKGITLDVSAAPDIGWVLVDATRLRQALFNLVGNAAKFTLVGGVHVRLTRAAGDALRFEVADTGVGIPEAALDRLFGQFQQGDSSTTRRFGGTGLGLAITRRLARLMGGDVGFESRDGVGSTFWLEVHAPPVEAPVAGAVDDAPLQNLRVLVVEDNATNRLIATRLLGSMGVSVETAQDGAEGVEAAARGGFDLILMDVQMPGMDGLEATRRIRALGGPAAATPIVALTANAMTHQRDSYLCSGMNGLVAKPISPPALLAEIARVLGAPSETESEAAAIAS